MEEEDIGSSPNASRVEFSEQEISFSQMINIKTGKILNKIFLDLYVACDRFVQFVKQLGQHRDTEIRDDLISHCEQSNKKKRIYETFMSDQIILRAMRIRIEKMIKNRRIKRNWSQEDVKILIWIISKYCDQKGYEDIEKQLDDSDWEIIASIIPGVTAESCMFKWLSLKKINLATNNWSQQESHTLSQLIKEQELEGKDESTKDWKLVSQNLYLQNTSEDKIYRNAKQCRQHWNCYLNPNLKRGPWQPQEDIKLLQCIKKNKGSKKWSQIVKKFNGRTENALKNRYTLIMEKQKRRHKNRNELDLIEECLVKCYLDQITNTDVKKEEEMPQDHQAPNETVNDIVESQPNSIQQDINYFQKEVRANQNLQGLQGNNQVPTTVSTLKVQKFQGGFNGSNQFIPTSMSKFDISSIKLGVIRNYKLQITDLQTDKSSTNIILYRNQDLQIKRYKSAIL